jgi:hypothetical protein
LVEGLLLGGVLLLSVTPAFSSKRRLKEYSRMGLGLMIYACVLAVLGYRNLIPVTGDYGLLMVGENVLRKKMMIMPIVLLWATFTLRSWKEIYNIEISL